MTSLEAKLNELRIKNTIHHEGEIVVVDDDIEILLDALEISLGALDQSCVCQFSSGAERDWCSACVGIDQIEQRLCGGK